MPEDTISNIKTILASMSEDLEKLDMLIHNLRVEQQRRERE